MERALIAEYERDAKEVPARLSPASADTALALLSLPRDIRGYGPVKAQKPRRRRPSAGGSS